jgi:hypothetical protein
MSPRRFHFDVYDVSITAQTKPPELSKEATVDVLKELFHTTNLNAEAIVEEARKTMMAILKDQFNLAKEVSWLGFTPYRLPIGDIFHPVLFIQYGNLEWAKQVGGNLIVVRRQGSRLPVNMFGEPKATFKVVERLAWAVEPLHKQ